MLAPSIISDAYYLVLDYGKQGRETVIDWEACSKADILQKITRQDYNGQLLEVHCIDRNDGRWANVSEDVAREVCDAGLPEGDAFQFCEQHLGCEHMADLSRDLAAA